MRDDDLIKQFEKLERQLTAIANTLTRHVFPRLDRLENELQIDDPVAPESQ